MPGDVQDWTSNVINAMGANAAVTLQFSAPAGQPVITVPSVAIFQVGINVLLVQLASATFTLATIKAIDPATGNLTLTGNVPAGGMAVGDVVAVVPTVVVSGATSVDLFDANNAPIKGETFNAKLRLPTSGIPLPFDVASQVAAGVGVMAQVILAAVAGKRIVCSSFAATWVDNSLAGGAQSTVVILDGAATIWAEYVGLPAVAGTLTRVGHDQAAIAGTAGNSMTVGFNAGVGNTSQAVSAGGYLQ